MKNKTKDSKKLLIILFVLFGLPGVFMPMVLIYCIFTRQFDISILFGYIFFDGITLILLNEFCKKKGNSLWNTKLGHMLLLIWMFPIGLFLLWKNNRNKTVNGIVTGIVGILLIIGFATADPQKIAEKRTQEETERSLPITEENNEITTTKNGTTEATTTEITTETSIETTTEPTTTTETTTEPVETTEIITTEKQTTTTIDRREKVSDYVLNTDTKKAHNPTCRDIAKMDPNNIEEFQGTINDLINMGYEPCGHCRPW